MGDFLIDFRPEREVHTRRAASYLKFFEDMQVTVIEHEKFTLVLTSSDDARLWGPLWLPDSRVSVALCGRIALEQSEWERAESLGQRGGLACGYLSHLYCEKGLQGLAQISGNFVIIILDEAAQQVHLVTDRWGLLPAFRHLSEGPAILASHPDALADAAGDSGRFDLVSIAEFVLTCRLSAPFTYYERIRAIPCGSITTIDLSQAAAGVAGTKLYFDHRYRPEAEFNCVQLADELAAALRKAVSKRTLPILGRTAVALSGGLDSRTVLCAASAEADLLAFCCHDEENDEFQIAKAIASAAAVEFIPMPRGTEYYTDTAALGVRISGGMGCIASNHFLGIRNDLIRLDVRNLLTGCYCDYLFKGLAFNKRVGWWTGTESPGAFDFAYYSRHVRSDTPLGRAVRERLEAQFPTRLRRYRDEAEYAEVESLRLFPLAYEEDNAERTIPQRVMGWYVPVAENDLLAVARKMPSRMKLNRKLFTTVVQRICGPHLAGIPDANTGLPVGAGRFAEAVRLHVQRSRRLVNYALRSRSGNGSWLDWNDYVKKSRPFRVLWERPSPVADDVFRQILEDGFSRSIEDYAGQRLSLLLQLFTLKLWFNRHYS